MIGGLGFIAMHVCVAAPLHLFKRKSSLYSDVVQRLGLETSLVEETDLSDVASGASHRPVLRGTSAKDVHWYVARAF